MHAKLVARFVIFVAVVAAALFVPAGTLRFRQGWAYLAVNTAANVLLVLYLWRFDRELLERRLQGRESTVWRQALQVAAALFWFGAMMVAGLDHRFGWSRGMPVWVEVLALAVAAGSYRIHLEVFRANHFAAHTVRVEEEQGVVSTGPYRWVRHPMYAGIGLLAVCTPLALGSCYGLIPAALMIAVLVLRLLDEEKLLRRELPGYAEYCGTTRWRLAPGLF